MTRRGRILTSVAVAGMAAWALWLAPLERPRVVLRDVDAHHVWFSPDGRLLATAEYFGEKGTRLRVWQVADGRPLSVLYDGDEEFPPRRAWGSIVGGTAAAGFAMYWFLAWRSRTTRHCATPSG